MLTMTRGWLTGALSLRLAVGMAVIACPVGALAQTTTHTNAAAITIPAFGTATPYPSVINVAGATANISYMTVRLNGFAHTFPTDVQVLLVSPTGQKTMLLSGVGGGVDVAGINLVFNQDAATQPTTGVQLLPGTYRPRNFVGVNLPGPAPVGPYTADLTVFNGLNANGTWTLYVNDRAIGDSGAIATGWSMTFNDTVREPGPIGTAITYQGQLTGAPPNSTAFLRFSLWDTESSTNTDNRVSGEVTRTVTLVDSVFTTDVDFGVSVQRQKALYIQIEAATLSVAGPYTTLTPRQRITGAPLALQLKGVTVDTNNQVGVGGIEDPQFVLETNGRIRVRGDAGASGGSPGIWFSSPNSSGVQVNRGFVGQLNDNNLGFFNGSWQLLLNDNGNVNIGDPSGTAPAERLTVTGNIQLNTAGRLSFGAVGNFNSTAENTDPMFFQRSNGPADISVLRLNVGDNATLGDSFIITTTINGTAFTERFRFNSDGSALKPGGGAWGVLSDATTKTGVTPMTGTLDKLMKLHGYSFSYKPEYVEQGRALAGTQLGLVAQEVQAVFPDWVGTSGDGKLFVTERATTALMVEALRDLRSEKDTQLEAKQREIDELKARMDRLEELMQAR